MDPGDIPHFAGAGADAMRTEAAGPGRVRSPLSISQSFGLPQVDPTYVYAYTLAGHEYFATEDFDKGLGCYRHALRLDARHYNAWCVC